MAPSRKTYLALVPARAGSKGLPRKNLLPLEGKPLIAWSIEQGLAAQRIDRVLVSTDGQEIADTAIRYGAEVPFLRPAEISGDGSSTELALIHAVNELAAAGWRPDFVVLLQPTCPVRAAGAIDAAISLIETHNADSLVSAREIHPFLWTRPDDALAQYNFRARPMRQSVGVNDRLYEENGSIYITRTDVLLSEGWRLGGKIVIFPMSARESIDIDVFDDLALAEATLRIMSR